MVQSQADECLSIGAFARKGGVGVETVRYYQRQGLLRVPKSPGGIRRYGPEDLRRLRFIRHAQSAGFTLSEIGELLDLDACDDRKRAREMALTRLDALDRKISELEAARSSLMRLADECNAGSRGPCPILSAFDD